jgi:hypothetical protein
MPIENSFFSNIGRGNWTSCCEGIIDTLAWSSDPWELLPTEELNLDTTAKSIKLYPKDFLQPAAAIECCSATDWETVPDHSLDLVVTDPPFGDLIQYAEWSDFFYVWLRPLLRRQFGPLFSAPYTPRALEVVSNRARNPEDADGFYRNALTGCWETAFRKLKAGGILTFTFHHHQDGPWIDVLESLFNAGFILEATFPVRGDETKGDGQYGSQKVEYDIIHVCRKRLEAPTRVSWARMRREVLQDVRQLQQLLEHHRKDGLPAADLQVIRRGKALEYFSRHYGQVYVNDVRPITVKEALVGINQLIDEEAGAGTESPPANAEPLTRQFLRIFDGKAEEKRDQMQKYLRGTGVAPDEYVDLGWCEEVDKIFRPVPPLRFAQAWHGRHRRNLVRDYDQAMVLTGACFENSGINAADTVKNDNFSPRPSLKALLDWFARRGSAAPIRTAASRALAIYQGWEKANEAKARQLSLFDEA